MIDSNIVDELIHGWQVGHVVEIGTYFPNAAQTANFIEAGHRVTLIEPNPQACEALRQKWGKLKNITILNKAIFNKKCEKVFCQIIASDFHKPSSSWLHGVRSPYLEMHKTGQIPDVQTDKIKVQCVTFDEIDTGKIDLLFVDAEGCEWYVIQKMKSRPRLIKLETHGNHGYINPFMKQINTWMGKNSYREVTKTRSDTIWILNKTAKSTSASRSAI